MGKSSIYDLLLMATNEIALLGPEELRQVIYRVPPHASVPLTVRWGTIPLFGDEKKIVDDQPDMPLVRKPLENVEFAQEMEFPQAGFLVDLAHRRLEDIFAGFNASLRQYEFLNAFLAGQRHEHFTVGDADNYSPAGLALTDSGWFRVPGLVDGGHGSLLDLDDIESFRSTHLLMQTYWPLPCDQPFLDQMRRHSSRVR